jgi:hypothetical protein
MLGRTLRILGTVALAVLWWFVAGQAVIDAAAGH